MPGRKNRGTIETAKEPAGNVAASGGDEIFADKPRQSEFSSIETGAEIFADPDAAELPADFNPAEYTPEPDAAESADAPESASEAPRRRGRPPGSKNASKNSATVKASITGLETILLSSHAMLAALTGAEELLLDPEEAHKLAEASARVAELYGTAVDPKTAALIALATVAGGIYIPRVIALRMRLKAEAKDKPRAPTLKPEAQQPAPNTFDLSAAGGIWSGIKP